MPIANVSATVILDGSEAGDCLVVNKVLASYNLPGTWAAGDFTYDGQVGNWRGVPTMLEWERQCCSEPSHLRSPRAGTQP